MKSFIVLALLLIGFAFMAPVSGSNLPPPVQLTVSIGQHQLDQIAIVYSNVEQNVYVTTNQPSYVYQVSAVMPEIVGCSNLPQPPYLYSTAAAGSTTFKSLSDKSCIIRLICIDVSKKALNSGYNRISMRQVARNAVMSNSGFYNCSFNPNALIRML